MDLLDNFINYFKAQRNKPSALTVKNYKADVGQFINWFEKEFKSSFDPSKITLQILEQYKKTRILSPSSIQRHVSSLRKFFSFLKATGVINFELFPVQDNKDKIEPDPWMLRNFKSYLYEYKKSHLTIKNYINDMKSFFLWLAEVSLTKYTWDVTERNLLDKINLALVEEYKQRLISAKFSPRTINRKLSSLRNYISWAKSQGLIPKNSEYSEHQNVRLSDNQTTRPSDSLSIPSIPNENYKLPPVRLIQKSLKGVNLIFDNLFILPIAKSIEGTQYLFWKVSGKRIFKKNVILNEMKDPMGFFANAQHDKVLNIQKEFYAPLNVSTRYLPTHKRVWHVLRHVRPNWYKTYHSYSITHYFHFAILIILASAIGFGTYNGLFADVQKESTLAATSFAPPRILSFQGKLTDSSNNPITTTTNILFSIYNDENAPGAAFLWKETNSVKPDSDGIFSVLLGKNTPIPNTLFTQNPELFLGITVGSSPELSPRQQLATVPFAGNSETLQGLEPITNTTKVSNVVLALDSSGNLSIAGSKAHTFQAIGGQFVLSGSILSLTTVPGSNSRVEIVPDGIGKIDLSKPIQNSTNNNNLSSAKGAVEFDDMVAILATTSGQAAFYINQNSTGPLISASTSGTAKFVVENDGSGIFSEDLGINGGDLTSTATTFNLLNSTVTTLNVGGAATSLVLGASTGTVTIRNATASIQGSITLGDAATDTLTFTGRVAQDSDLLPIGTTGTNDLGSSSLPWDNAYIDNIYSASTGTSGYWQRANGSVFPTNITDDLLLGATSTSSAKFGFINVGGGNPTATISSNLSLAVPTGNGPASTLNLLNNGSLNIQRSVGGNAGLATALYIQNNGNVGIGNTAPATTLDVTGTLRASSTLTVSGNVSFDRSGGAEIDFGSAGSAATFQFRRESDPAVAFQTFSSTGQQSRLEITTGTTAEIDIKLANLDMNGNDIISSSGNLDLIDQVYISGNLGIGTTTPLLKLDVQDSQAATAAAQIFNTNTGTDADGLIVKLGNTSTSVVTSTNHFISFQTAGIGIVGSVQGNGGKGVTYATSGIADFAEYFKKDQNQTIEYGAVACLNNTGLIVPCDNNSNKIIGVASEHPAFLGGENLGNGSIAVGLIGQVETFVSTVNGKIKAGDILTASDIPGVAIKATKAGQIIGKALEDLENIDESKVVGFYDPDNKEYRSKANFPDIPIKPNIIRIVKIYTFVNVSWYDPGAYLTNTGDLIIHSTGSNGYSVSNTQNQTLTDIAGFFEIVAANIKAGLIQASEVVTSSLIVTTDTIIVNGQNLKDYIVKVVQESPLRQDFGGQAGIISPVASIDRLYTNIISPLGESLIVRLATPSAEIQNPSFIIQDSSGSSVAKIDDHGNASFSGQLKASDGQFEEASISGVLRARSIITESIQGFIDIASFSAQIAYVPNLQVEQGLFNQGLIVFGGTSLSDLSVVGQLSIGGTMFVTENSIETLGTNLSLQSLRQGGLSIMGGLVYIDTDGNLKAQGNVAISGKLAVNIISPLPTSDLVINNASGSSVLAVNQKGDITASGSGTFAKINFNFVEPALAVSPTELIASSSAGSANISSFQTEVTIKNHLVTDKSLIYITPVGTPSAQAPFLMRQVPDGTWLRQQSSNSNSLQIGSFTVGVESPNKNPIPFNWLIIN